MGLLEQATELARANNAQDDKYLKSFIYFFELRIPSEVAKLGESTLIYPLIIAPESIRMSEPFTVEATNTNNSGLYVEENGIIGRELTISGNTGWKPRKFPGKTVSATAGAVKIPSEGKSYSRAVPFNVLEALSGQRHFQFLQDAVFRTYGDLKRDPATAKGTELFWHDPKNDEHWRVIPRSFEMSRDAGSQNLYQYTIQLLCVEGAAQSQLTPSEDFNVLEALKNANLMMNYGLTQANAALQNLTGVQNEVRTSIQGMAGILDDAAVIVTAMRDFLTGTAAFATIPGVAVSSAINAANILARASVQVPYAFVEATRTSLELTLNRFNESVILGSSPDVDGSLLNSFRRLQDGLDIFLSYPDKFELGVDAAVRSFNARTTPIVSDNTQDQSALTAPQSIAGFSQLGTAPLPGSFLLSSNGLDLGANAPRYQSAIERIIEHGDTIPNLAARYLGDARLWKYITIFNNLQPPYLSDLGLPGTLDVGDTVLIPSTSRRQEAKTSPSTLGVNLTLPAAEHELGQDLLLSEVARGQYDLEVDLEGGSVDIRNVAGIPNLSQAIRTRLITERGTDTLYKSLGTQQVVGLGLTPVDLETAQLRLVTAVQDDPRVSAVRKIDLTLGPPDDAVLVEMDVEVRGFSRPEKIVIRK